MSEPEKGLQQPYKCILNQLVQKLWKQLPIYETMNEGYDHHPLFRTTVRINQLTYKSPHTFQHRKLAEHDTSKFTLGILTHELGKVATKYIENDKSVCKSVLVEYAVKMKIENHEYMTLKRNQLLQFSILL